MRALRASMKRIPTPSIITIFRFMGRRVPSAENR
jgi:hypothetical protein